MNGKLLPGILVVLALAGCASSPPPRTDLLARDDGVFLPVVRVSKSIAASSVAPSALADGVAIEVSASRASGSGSQALAGGAAPVEYNGQVFSAPQTLQHDFDLAVFDASGRWRHFFPGSAVGVELLLGFAYSELDLAVAGASGRASGTESMFGPVFGGGFLVRLGSSTSAQARFTYYTAFEDESGMRFEVALAQSLGRNFSVRAGYAYTRFEFDQDTASIVEVRASGPMLGLELHF